MPAKMRATTGDEGTRGAEIGDDPGSAAEIRSVKVYSGPSPVPCPSHSEGVFGDLWCDLWLWTMDDWEATPPERRPPDDGRFFWFKGKGMLWAVPKGTNYPRPWEA